VTCRLGRKLSLLALVNTRSRRVARLYRRLIVGILLMRFKILEILAKHFHFPNDFVRRSLNALSVQVHNGAND
jgi:hypothetical protein